MNTLAQERAECIPLASACKALAIHRSTFYARGRRHAESAPPRRSRQSVRQPRALTAAERQSVREVLHSEEFRDQPPAEVYQHLLERGTHLCSISTMHRILREDDESGDRRDQRAAKHHAVPRLLAEAPNAVWTWDCSKLATRARRAYLTLYVVLDLFNRFVLAWMVSRKDNSALARQLMNEAAIRYRIGSGQLTVHQDRGAPMIAHRYIDQMTELGIVLSHSRHSAS
jgi:putative transposase